MSAIQRGSASVMTRIMSKFRAFSADGLFSVMYSAEPRFSKRTGAGAAVAVAVAAAAAAGAETIAAVDSG